MPLIIGLGHSGVLERYPEAINYIQEISQDSDFETDCEFILEIEEYWGENKISRFFVNSE